MSIKSVQREIQKALANDPPAIGCQSGKRIDGDEAGRILTTAERGPVTSGEAKLVGDLFSRQPRPTPPGSMVTLACPENPGAVSFDQKAAKSFEQFFVKYDLPYGANEASVKARIEAAMNDGLGPQLAGPPKNLDHLSHVFIRDMRMVDGPRTDAYVDTSKGEFYVKSTGAGMGGPHTIGPFWYGPVALPPRDKDDGAVSPATQQKIRDAFDAASNLKWSNDLPAGVRFVRVPLKSDGFPDGYDYTALVPAGALSPTAPKADPNDAERFFVERSGGFAGLTQYAGPIELGGAVAVKPKLPQGIHALEVSAVSTFGALAPLVQIEGEVNNPNWYVTAGRPQIDEKAKTVTIPISAAEAREVQIITPVTRPFKQLIPLDGLTGKSGNWTINLTDDQGQLLRSATLNQSSCI